MPGDVVRHCWSGDVGIGALPWLVDHAVHGTRVLPGAGFWALAISAACEVFHTGAQEVEAVDFRFRELLPVTERTGLDFPGLYPI